MQAIILAAGMGRRLGELTQNDTKCMLHVNGSRLIDRTLEQLSHFPLSRIVMVVGYGADHVRSHIGKAYHDIPVCYVENKDYATTNNIYSLYLAKDLLAEDDTLLLESDIIFDAAVLEKIIANPYPNLTLVDKYENWMDGTVVTLDEDFRISDFITREHFRFEETDHYYKTVNIHKFSREFSLGQYIPFLDAYCRALGNNAYYEQVLRVISLLEDSPLKALALDGERWYEIDDIQDLDIAESLFADSDEEAFRAIASRYGGYWRYPQIKDFCYLVNPYYPTQRMVEELKHSFEVLLRQYPSGMSVNSLLAAKNFAIRQDYVVVGNGAAELIKALMERSCGMMGVTIPTFEEYPNRRAVGEVVRYQPEGRDFHYSADNLMTFFGSRNIDTLLIINPDNPSGNYIGFDDLLRLAEWCEERQIRLVVDESFVDFADVEGKFSLLDNTLLERYSHLVVVKSISKSYGVPGLRLGILASSDKSLIGALKKEVAIWNINSFGEYYMQIAEKYEGDYRRACRQFKEERARFQRRLEELPYLRVIPSQGNYFLCEVLPPMTSRGLCVQMLKRHRVLLKDCSGKVGFGDQNYIRIAIRDRADNDKLIEALKQLR